MGSQENTKGNKDIMNNISGNNNGILYAGETQLCK